MERSFLRVLLYEGKWGRKLTPKAIESSINRAVTYRGMITHLEYVDPIPDVAFEIEIVILLYEDWDDKEIARDVIVRELLIDLDPEYESMVEVEIE